MEDLDQFKEDQIVQLYELMKAATQTADDQSSSSSTDSQSDKDANKGKKS